MLLLPVGFGAARIASAFASGLGAPLPGTLAIVGAGSFACGTVPAGAEIRHAFRLRNEGSGVVRLARVETSCGCATGSVVRASAAWREEAYVFGEAIEPGEWLRVDCRADTSHRRGGMSATFRFWTGDGAGGPLAAHLTATVVPVVTASRDRIEFGLLAGGESATRSVELLAGANPVRLELVTEDGSELRAELKALSPRDGEGRAGSWRLSVTRAAMGRADIGEGRLLVETIELRGDCRLGGGSPAKPFSLHIPVLGRLVGALSTDPRTLALGVVSRGALVERTLSVRCDAGADETVDVRFVPGEGSAWLERAVRLGPVDRSAASDAPRVLPFRFDTSRAPALGSFRGTVELRWEQHLVRVPLFGRVVRDTEREHS